MDRSISAIDHNGYKIKVFNKEYIIYLVLPTGKWKAVRRMNSTTTVVDKTRYGRFYKEFKDDEHALQTAKNYIDNFLVK